MQKILISIQDDLASRFRSAVPAKQRSQFIASLLEKAMSKKEDALYRCALAVENDRMLHEEMKDWDVTVGDGVQDESW